MGLAPEQCMFTAGGRSSSIVFGLAAVALAAWATESEAHASVCEVNNTQDNAAVPKTLRWCVAQVTLPRRTSAAGRVELETNARA